MCVAVVAAAIVPSVPMTVVLMASVSVAVVFMAIVPMPVPVAGGGLPLRDQEHAALRAVGPLGIGHLGVHRTNPGGVR